jgi:hypothetical protein
MNWILDMEIGNWIGLDWINKNEMRCLLLLFSTRDLGC